MSNSLWFAIISSVIAIAYGLFLVKSILKKNAGNEKMQSIANAIAEGAKAYLNRQYKTIGVIAIILFVLLWISIWFSLGSDTFRISRLCGHECFR